MFNIVAPFLLAFWGPTILFLGWLLFLDHRAERREPPCNVVRFPDEMERARMRRAQRSPESAA